MKKERNRRREVTLLRQRRKTTELTNKTVRVHYNVAKRMTRIRSNEIKAIRNGNDLVPESVLGSGLDETSKLQARAVG